MKPGIHPEYMQSKITCACGRVTETYATVEEIHVEICSHCHPFYTGRQKLVDTAGRVERFRRKYGSTEDEADSEEENGADASAAADETDAAEIDAVAEGDVSDEAASDGASAEEDESTEEESTPQPVGAAGDGPDEPADEGDD